MGQVRIERIDTAHSLYEQQCDLRDRVLLHPIGYDMARYRDEFPGYEERFEHFIGVVDLPGGEPRVVGCVSLLPDDPGPDWGKLAQMAVDPQRQGEGIGKQLIAALEARAFGDTHHGGLGLKALFCHARMDAIPFYERVGWLIEGDLFQEAGVDHKRMVIHAPAPVS
ncbi:MAG: GNAT family N-acetyltransferase [Planctomycetota bacterium]